MREPRAWNYHDLLHRHRRSRLLGRLALAAFVLLVLVVIRILLLPGSSRVTIGAGKSESTIHQFVLSLVRDSVRRNLDIEPVFEAGTIDMLNQVESGQLDFAIVHGGFDMDHFHNIRQVAVLSVAPVHLLIKNDYHAAVSEDLRNLRGRTINLGTGAHTGHVLAKPGDPLIRRS